MDVLRPAKAGQQLVPAYAPKLFFFKMSAAVANPGNVALIESVSAAEIHRISFLFLRLAHTNRLIG